MPIENREEKLTYLEWADAIGGGSDWTEESRLKEWKDGTDWIIKQCGFIISENSKHILFAGSIKPKDVFTERQFCGLLKIPKTWIRKRVDLTKYI